MARKRKFSILILFVLTIGISSCLFSERLSHARVAEQLRAEGKYKEAITEYEKHISARISAAGKDPGENPYFYRILIGDVYLESGDLVAAESSYVEAVDHGVDKQLVASKLRGLAEKMVEEMRVDDAMEMLRRHQDYDPLMINLEIDRLYKTTLTLPQ